MNKHKRKFLELFGLSYLSVILLPYNLLFSVTKKLLAIIVLGLSLQGCAGAPDIKF